MTVYKLPFRPGPQVLNTLLGSFFCQLRLIYADADNGEGGWILDINDSLGEPVLCGIPLVTGVDLLAQYGYIGLGVPLYVVTDGDRYAVPTFDSLGNQSNVYFEV